MKTTPILIPALGLLLASGTALAMHHHAKADTDGDGAISKDEFMEMHTKKAEKMFEKLDADGDGQITAEERKTAREKFKKHHQMHEE